MNKLFNSNKDKKDMTKDKEKLWFSIFMIAVIFLGFLTILPDLVQTINSISFPPLNPNKSIIECIDNPPSKTYIITDREITESDQASLMDKLRGAGLEELIVDNNSITANFFEISYLQSTQSLSLSMPELGALINLVIASTTNIDLSFLELSILEETLYAVSSFNITEFLIATNISTVNKNIYLINNYTLVTEENKLLLNPTISSINGYPNEANTLFEELLNYYLAEIDNNYAIYNMNAYLIDIVVNTLLSITQTTLNISENVINFYL